MFCPWLGAKRLVPPTRSILICARLPPKRTSEPVLNGARDPHKTHSTMTWDSVQAEHGHNAGQTKAGSYLAAASVSIRDLSQNGSRLKDT